MKIIFSILILLFSSSISFTKFFNNLEQFRFELVISGIIILLLIILRIQAYLTLTTSFKISSVKIFNLYITICGMFLLAISKLAVPEHVMLTNTSS